MRAVVFLVLFIGTLSISKSASAADLPLATKPVVQAKTISPEEQRRQLFEECLRFLKKGNSH
jgi:hypothetical protein